ncbi:hypothetical protein RJ641_014766 [Dillenia turbinata]|uniref:Uncharacterized protein n=1 Tax=Dillenia turbinata TaxID=194707 RepID=A0AAN8V445_9MAGN
MPNWSGARKRSFICEACPRAPGPGWLLDNSQTLPDDLKTKFSIDDDLASSPEEALSCASADRRMKYLNRGSISHSYTTQREKHLSELTRLAINNTRFDGRTPDSPAVLANQGVITQLSEQISTLNEGMDEFTSWMEKLNAKIPNRTFSSSQQNLAVQADCNGSAPTVHFVAGLGNGSLTGPLLPHSSSSSQLARDSPLMEEILAISRSQCQILHQQDNLSNLLHEYWGQRSRQGKTDTARASDFESITVPLLVTLAIGGLFLFKGFSLQK